MFCIGDSVRIGSREFVVVGFDGGQAILMDDEGSTMKRYI